MSAKKPNIVFIMLDQWRGDCLGIADSPHPVMTPHIDQIAYEGIWYQRAYADCPLCMPQRATMLTGYTGSQHGMPYNFLVGPRSPISLEHSLPYRLTREADYQTKAIGKMHFYPERSRFGFEHVSLHPNDYVNWLEDKGYGGMYRGHGLGGNEVYPAVSAVPEQFTHTHWIVDESINFLSQRDPDNPFFLWMVFEAPHSPFDPPAPFDRLYNDFEIPEAVMGDWVNTDGEPFSLIEQRISNKADRITPQILRKLRRHYYGQITHIDYQLGRFFGELKRKNLYDDTIIVITSDHGEHLGDHGLFAKYTFLESSAHIPIILRLPANHPITTHRVTDPVLTADIPSTLLELAGLQANPDADGRSLLNLPQTRYIFGETKHSAFVTDGRWKYIYYLDRGIEQIFDVQTDPDDLHNLAENSPEKARLKETLRAYLQQHQRPLVGANGQFVMTADEIDTDQLRAQNNAAWRGPLRYGQGYE
ncbi:MAG: sulfatase-like hydrolase/transferase [Aggregatilineales bacterium]